MFWCLKWFNWKKNIFHDIIIFIYYYTYFRCILSFGEFSAENLRSGRTLVLSSWIEAWGFKLAASRRHLNGRIQEDIPARGNGSRGMSKCFSELMFWVSSVFVPLLLLSFHWDSGFIGECSLKHSWVDETEKLCLKLLLSCGGADLGIILICYMKRCPQHFQLYG